MNNYSFEPLNEYQLKENYKTFVPESLHTLNEKEDGMFGTIIDRGVSFIPRAMRFKKAKKIMSKFLIDFTKKAKNLITKFSKGLASKVKTIDTEYQNLLKNKIKPLIEENKREQALKLIESQKKELEEYRKEQGELLQKSIDDILSAYTNSIEKRIDSPGFVFNVELSEKGKGELRAKWQELVALQKIEIDKYKTKLIKSPGWKRLNEIIAELDTYMDSVKKHKKASDIDFHIQYIEPQTNNTYKVKVHIRTGGARLNVQEKGIIIGEDPNNLEYGKGSKIIKVTGNYAYNANPWATFISDTYKGYYVRPYIIDKNSEKPIYGDIEQIDPKTSPKEKENKPTIVGKSGGDLETEDKVVKNP